MRSHVLLLALPVTSSKCSALENFTNVQCYGLEKDETMPTDSGAEACRQACCDDPLCEVWQFNPLFACYRGKSFVCMRSADSFADGSVGERLRGAAAADAGGSMLWFGKRQTYAELVDLDPTAGPREQVVQGLSGETYRLWRHGSRLEVDVSCWSYDRRPQECCEWNGPPIRHCWGGAESMWQHCCQEGVSKDKETLYQVFTRTTKHLSPSEKAYFAKVLPEDKIDEKVFDATRSRWALGHHPPGPVCASSSLVVAGVKTTADGSTALWPLAMLLAAHMNLSGTFVNMGAGTCLHPDPLYQLLASPEGAGFLGLAVEADADRLHRCEVEMARSHATVVPVHLTLNPIDAARQLYPFLVRMFPEEPLPWPLDFLVVDLDSCDCLIAEELMKYVRPKVMQLEIAYHYPPPFRFSMHWDIRRSHGWNAEYDIDRLNPVSGCSLSYALHQFKPYGYHLLRLTPADAILVHDSVAHIVELGLGTKLPQDEFQCYRQSTLYVQMPGDYVREWFYARHPSLAFSQIWSNITSLNREMGREDVPFALDY